MSAGPATRVSVDSAGLPIDLEEGADRKSGTTTRVAVDSLGGKASGDSSQPSISANGRYVAFSSAASNLVPGDTNGVSDIFQRHLK